MLTDPDGVWLPIGVAAGLLHLDRSTVWYHVNHSGWPAVRFNGGVWCRLSHPSKRGRTGQVVVVGSRGREYPLENTLPVGGDQEEGAA